MEPKMSKAKLKRYYDQKFLDLLMQGDSRLLAYLHKKQEKLFDKFAMSTRRSSTTIRKGFPKNKRSNSRRKSMSSSRTGMELKWQIGMWKHPPSYNAF